MRAKMVNWVNKLEVQEYVKGFPKGIDIVFCGTHECAPEVIEDFIDEVLKPSIVCEITVPGDGEPSLYLAGDATIDRQEDIVTAYGEWYVIGFECEGDTPIPPQYIDTKNNYGLSAYFDTNNNILFLTITGDTEYENE